MYLPKTDIFNILSTLNYTVSQASQTVFNELPVITFEVLDNNVSLFLDNSISYQNVTIKIDIWAEDSVTASTILSEVEAIMRQNHYKMTFSGDVPNIDNSLYHISTRFMTNVG